MKIILILLGILLIWSFQCILFIRPSHFNGLFKKQGFFVGRLFNIPMSSGELYYLNILVTKVKDSKGYEDIRIVNCITYLSFRYSCYALGLLNDDKQFIEAITEASH